MILTGKRLESVGKAVWGDIWISVLSNRLKVSKRTILRWRAENHSMPKDLRQALLALIETQLMVVAEQRDILAAEWDDSQ